MNTALISRNLLIVRQAEEIASLCCRAAIPVVFLKGAALILLSGDYLQERMMEDIDLLVRPCDRDALRSLLKAGGYAPAPEDPWAFSRPVAAASIDLNDSLWYLDQKTNRMVFEDSLHYPLPGLPGAFHLPPDEFYLHILSHAAIHHAIQEPKWRNDLKVLEKLFGPMMERGKLEKKLRDTGMAGVGEIYLEGKENIRSLQLRFYRWLLSKDIPLKGHVTRFLFLPVRRKPGYLMTVLFPPAHFVSARYSAQRKASTCLYRLCRPFFLMLKLAAFLCFLPFARRMPEHQ